MANTFAQFAAENGITASSYGIVNKWLFSIQFPAPDHHSDLDLLPWISDYSCGGKMHLAVAYNIHIMQTNKLSPSKLDFMHTVYGSTINF